jgi:hypothetical protein
MMGLRQVSMFLGPLAAGALIAGGGGLRGLAFAFAVDAASFALSAWTLSKVVTQPQPMPSRQRCSPPSPKGCAIAGATSQLRALLGYGSAGQLLIAGPVQTALPVLAKSLPANRRRRPRHDAWRARRPDADRPGARGVAAHWRLARWARRCSQSTRASAC